MKKKEGSEKKSKYLFPGGSCYPMSPHVGPIEDDDQPIHGIHKDDQILVILEMLGKQQAENFDFLE